MSVPMKKRPTKEVELVLHDRSARLFRIPRDKANAILTLIQDNEVKEEDQLVPADEVFKDLYEKHGKSGTTIRGFRSRDDLSQGELAEKLDIHQTDLSQMENGKRPISKKMAQKLAKVFKTDYRVFL
jgi:DNA-binding XRE family transcriptional regulator